MEKNPSFKFRIAFIKYMSKLWMVFSPEYGKTLVQTLLILLADKVPNVKINAARASQRVIYHPKCPSTVTSIVTPRLCEIT
jgi:hypothetical protein